MGKPRHRPPNERRIRSMLSCFRAACVDSRVVIDAEGLAWAVQDYPGDLTPEEWLRRFIEVKRALPPAINDEDRGRFDPADMAMVDWFGSLNQELIPFSKGPRADRMTAYRIAASLFNHLLEVAHENGDRMDEGATTPAALQRAIHRYLTRKLTSV